jgi:uncharacterized protein (DUF433 family)
METATARDQTESSNAISSPPRDRVRIVSTPGTCGGRPRIDGHRVTVEDVAICHERMGMSPAEIVSSYPTITLSDVHAALIYYDQNRHRVDDDIEECRKLAEEMRAKARPSRLPELSKVRRVRQRILASQPREVGGVGSGTGGLWTSRPSVWRTGGVGDPRRTSRVCWARVFDPAHRCDRRSPRPWTVHRGGSERFGPTNSIARIRRRTLSGRAIARTNRFHHDENCHRAIAEDLRRRGVDVAARPEVGLLRSSDEIQRP